MPSVSYEPSFIRAFAQQPLIQTSTSFFFARVEGGGRELRSPLAHGDQPEPANSMKPKSKSREREPGEGSPPPLGIDLGTTFTCAGVYMNDWVEIIPNEEGNRKTPSCVAFRDEERLIGDAARDQAPMNAANTVYDLKRIVGRRFSDASVQTDILLWPFRVSPGPRDQPCITVRWHGEERQFSAEEVCAMLLGKMKDTAEAFLRSPVTECVVAVPATFNMAQRQATANAGALAGLKVLRVVSEPSAAALAFVLHKESVIREGDERKVLIFDFGGGTISVAVIFVEGGILEVKAMAGDSHLGGADFDRRLVRHFADEFKKQHKRDMSGNARALRKLETACERVKRSLAMTSRTTIDIDALFDGIDFYCPITRAQFEEISADLFEQCLAPVRRCLLDAKVAPEAIDDVVLVGGSTRIPKVQQLLQEFFGGKELSKNVNPDEAVAFGAAMYAAILGDKGGSQLAEILPLEVVANSIGIETGGGSMTTILKRNNCIPTLKRMEFTTYTNSHTSVLLNVYEGEEPRAADNNLVGVYELTDLPPAPPDGLKIVVIVDIDSFGYIQISAETVTGQKIKCNAQSPSTPLYPSLGYLPEEES
ncbi:hypothetical protein MPTK2_3g22900 [Marchantia polymorpha subsp. ruderalis]